jgi:hypothetical protein
LVKRALPRSELLRGQAVSIAHVAQTKVSLPDRGNDVGLHPHAPPPRMRRRHVFKRTIEVA